MDIKWSEKLHKIIRCQKSRHLLFKGRRKRLGEIRKGQKIRLSKSYQKGRELFLFLEKYFWFLIFGQRLISHADVILSYCNRSNLQINSWEKVLRNLHDLSTWRHFICKSFTFMATEHKGRFFPKFKSFFCLFVFKHKSHGIFIESREQKFRLNNLGMIFILWKKHSLYGLGWGKNRKVSWALQM